MQHEHILKYVEERLQQWADWTVRQNDFGLGYRNQTIEAHLMQYGNVVIQKSNLPNISSHPQAEEIEKYICILAKQTRVLADTIRVYYLTVGTMPQKAQKLNISYAQLKVYLNMARQWLAGKLS